MNRIRGAVNEQKRNASGVAKLAFFVSVISLLVTILTLIFHLHESSETTAVKVIPEASVNSLGSTPAGYAVRISLVNDSLRPVVITSMNLTVGGKVVAPIRTFLPGAFADAGSLGDRPLFDAHSLPFSLAPRGAETLTGIADFSEADTEVKQGKKGAAKLKLARRFCKKVDPPRSKPVDESEGLVREPESTIGLEIESEPPGSEELWTTSAAVSQPTDPPNVWRLRILGRRRHPTGMRFWLPTSSPSAFRFVTLRIWRRDGRLVDTRSVAVAGASGGRLRFSALAPGSYRAALSRRDGILAIATFQIPLKRGERVIFPARAEQANGQCLEIRGYGDIFSHHQ